MKQTLLHDNDPEFTDQSTYFYTADQPLDGNDQAPQQSFIFGAEQFYGSSSITKSQRARDLFFSNTYDDIPLQPR